MVANTNTDDSRTQSPRIEMLVDAGLLTERQAEAYVRRRIEGEPGFAVAESMGINESTLSGYVSDAEEKIEAARETAEVFEKIRDQIPLTMKLEPGVIFQNKHAVWKVVDERSADEGNVPEETIKVEALASTSASEGHTEWLTRFEAVDGTTAIVYPPAGQ